MKINIKNKASLCVRILCAIVFLFFILSHSFSIGLINNNDLLQSEDRQFSSTNFTEILSSQICTSDGSKEVNSNRNDADCQTSTPCHACRIGDVVLPPPVYEFSFHIPFVDFVDFLPNFGDTIINKPSPIQFNVAPCAPPMHYFA